MHLLTYDPSPAVYFYYNYYQLDNFRDVPDTLFYRIPDIPGYQIPPDKVRRQNSTTAEEIARFQRLFPNPSWLTSERTSGHQNLVSIFPGIDSCVGLSAKG